MRTLITSIILHIGAGIRFGCLRLFGCRQGISYKHIRYGSDASRAIDRADNNLVNGFIGFLVLALILLCVFASCSNRHDITDNYSVFTYGEGLYGERVEDYPIFVSKLGYNGEPPYIPNVKQVWWDSSNIIIEQYNRQLLFDPKPAKP